VRGRVVGALRSVYEFFAGDTILLCGVALAFGLAAVLVDLTDAPTGLVAILFVAAILGGLVAALGRELRGRSKPTE
jgi:membrane protein implicated in regulation of membrane protease activity